MNLTTNQTGAIRNSLNLTPEIKLLISLANTDIYSGTWGLDDDDQAVYPGFTKACALISAEIPAQLWLNTEADYVLECCPVWSCKCDQCNGNGLVAHYDNDGTMLHCQECNGEGMVGLENPEHWVQLDRSQIKRAVVGAELAAHL